MAAPNFVPITPGIPKSYRSPDRLEGSWFAERPGEIEGRQPEGDRLGSPGPDQGYVVVLTDTIAGTLELGSGEHEADAMAAIGAVALKRASAFGRSPVIHDVTAAVSVLGLRDAVPNGTLADRRRERLEEAHHPHFYEKLRSIADDISTTLLQRPLDVILREGTTIDW